MTSMHAAMVSLLVIVLVVAFLVWLISQLVPLPAWVGKAAFIVWVTVATLMLSGATINL